MSSDIYDIDKSFVCAVQQKYGSTEDAGKDETPVGPVLVYYRKPSHQNSDYEELVLPPLLALNFSCIAHAGPMSQIAGALSTVRELDISMNSLKQWQEVFSIIACMPCIFFLNLSNNPLCESDLVDVNQRIPAFDSIQHLVLNGTKLSWQTVVQLLHLMPGIQELHLSCNQYTTVDISMNMTFPSLKQVFLSSNEISSWSDVCWLGRSCPNLSNLVLISNPLSQIERISSPLLEQNESSADDLERSDLGLESIFPVLKSLTISKTQFKSWEEIEKLAHIPKLTEIKMTGIDFFENIEEGLRRKLAIGYLKNVEKLNGSDISDDERDIAHRAFVRHYMNENEKPSRYFELVDKIGRLDPLADVNLRPVESIRVTVCHENQSILKTFKSTATIAEVKRILSRELVDQPESSFDIFHQDIGAPWGQEKLKFLHKNLYSYRVKSGDELHIHVKE